MSVYIVTLNQEKIERFIGLFSTFENAQEAAKLCPCTYGDLTISEIDLDKVYITRIEDMDDIGKKIRVLSSKKQSQNPKFSDVSPVFNNMLHLKNDLNGFYEEHIDEYDKDDDDDEDKDDKDKEPFSKSLTYPRTKLARNAYLFFASEVGPDVTRVMKIANEGMKPKTNDVCLKIATMWNDLSEKDRYKYHKMADEDKERYNAEVLNV
jgi:hypothetical protein